MLIIHDSQELFYRSPFGAVETEGYITLRIKVDSDTDLKSVILRLWKNHSEERVEMTLTGKDEEGDIFEARIQAPSEVGLLWYYFIIEGYDRVYFYGNNSRCLGGVGEIYNYPPHSFQITVFERGFRTPEWFKDGVIYQIFVDRFFNGNEDGAIHGVRENHIVHSSWDETPLYKPVGNDEKYHANDFFGGNLKGIIKKIPYLKNLGVTVLYLNPIFEAFSNHKYDTGDYSRVDPMFGTNEEFINLCSVLRENGISVILDGVFSHTGSDSLYFNRKGRYPEAGAYQSKQSLYYPWYSFASYPDNYECWWGFETLPNVNELYPSYLNFIIEEPDSISKRWLRYGALGWRLDVADELPDEFLIRFRKGVKETNPDAVIIGEVWEDVSHKLSYGHIRDYLLGEQLDSVMNYPLRTSLIRFLLGEISAEDFNKEIMSLYENYPKECFYSLMNLIGSHDVPRAKTLLGEAPYEDSLSKDERANYRLSHAQEQLAIKRLKIAALFQLTFPGVPCIYYGDEVGLEGYRDPFNRRTYPWGRENKELIEWYKMIIKLRKELDALRTGDFIPVYYKEDVYGFLRIIEGNKDVFGQERQDGFALVILNRSKKESYEIEIDVSDWKVQSFFDVLNDNKEIEVYEGCIKVKLLSLEGKVFLKKI